MASRTYARDAQGFYEIHITTVPRYKTSGLSGDEWRIPAKVVMMRKGRIIATKHFQNVQTAARFLDFEMMKVHDTGECDLGHPAYKELCDQEGCQEVATTKLKLKARYCSEGHRTPMPAWLSDGEYRQFCNEHKTRGNSSLEDCDSNYEEIN